MDHIYQLHQLMRKEKIILSYEGEFTQEITKAVLSMAEKNLDYVGEEISVKRKVFNVMVECLQNVVKHADEVKDYENSAVFVIGKEDDEYSISSGNYMLSKNVEPLQNKLEHVNTLDKDGLKNLYREIIKEGTLSDKGGAGLGFIDMARKSGNKLLFNFHKVNDEHSFFTLKTRIARIKQ